MNFPFPILALFLIFIAVTTVLLFRSNKKDKERKNIFWETENKANATRAQDISNLPYIQIPIDFLPFSQTSDEILNECQNQIRQLAEQKILNLTGISNTELKLQYGAPNLQFLSDCDNRFTSLCQLIQKWANQLNALGYTDEAACVLEYGIGWGSDIKASYLLLGELYFQNGQFHQIDDLIASAEKLNSLSKASIIEALSSF